MTCRGNPIGARRTHGRPIRRARATLSISASAPTYHREVSGPPSLFVAFCEKNVSSENEAHASANGRERPRCTFDTNAWQISRGQEFVSEHPETARAVSRRRVAPMPSPLPHWLFATPLGVVSPSFRARDEKTDAHRENAADDHSAHRWDGTRGPNLWPPLRAQLLRTGSTRGGPTRARSRL